MNEDEKNLYLTAKAFDWTKNITANASEAGQIINRDLSAYMNPQITTMVHTRKSVELISRQDILNSREIENEAIAAIVNSNGSTQQQFMETFAPNTDQAN